MAALPEGLRTTTVLFNAFNVAFSDLDRQTVNLRNLPLDDLARELARRIDESRDTIEIFGAKLPSTILASVCTLMLLACHLYLFLLLQEMFKIVGRTVEPLPTGYIGLYDQPVAQGVAAITLVALPAVAVWLVLSNDRRSLVTMIVAVSVGISLGVINLMWLRRTCSLHRSHEGQR